MLINFKSQRTSHLSAGEVVKEFFALFAMVYKAAKDSIVLQTVDQILNSENWLPTFSMITLSICQERPLLLFQSSAPFVTRLFESFNENENDNYIGSALIALGNASIKIFLGYLFQGSYPTVASTLIPIFMGSGLQQDFLFEFANIVPQSHINFKNVIAHPTCNVADPLALFVLQVSFQPPEELFPLLQPVLDKCSTLIVDAKKDFLKTVASAISSLKSKMQQRYVAFLRKAIPCATDAMKTQIGLNLIYLINRTIQRCDCQAVVGMIIEILDTYLGDTHDFNLLLRNKPLCLRTVIELSNSGDDAISAPAKRILAMFTGDKQRSYISHDLHFAYPGVEFFPFAMPLITAFGSQITPETLFLSTVLSNVHPDLTLSEIMILKKSVVEYLNNANYNGDAELEGIADELIQHLLTSRPNFFLSD
jgi:hypothetical protein